MIKIAHPKKPYTSSHNHGLPLQHPPNTHAFACEKTSATYAIGHSNIMHIMNSSHDRNATGIYMITRMTVLNVLLFLKMKSRGIRGKSMMFIGTKALTKQLR